MLQWNKQCIMLIVCCTVWILGQHLGMSAGADGPRVYPVYAASRSAELNASESMDIVVGTAYKVHHQPQRRTDEESMRSSEEDVYLVGEKEACRRDSITSCWTYNSLSFIQSLLQPLPLATTMGRSAADGAPHLVGLPIDANASYTVLGRSTSLGFGAFYAFLERYLSRFVQTHGILFPATSWEEAVVEEFQRPAIIEEDNEVQDARSSHQQRKVKRKSILFPLLVLFKFFKIKMILVPILLTVLLVKKLLIVTLALAPNLIGFFRVCRPAIPPPFGLTSAGLLQDVTDSRGEFSTLYNSYVNPYRDSHGYRTRDFGRYSEPLRQPPTEPPMDYS